MSRSMQDFVHACVNGPMGLDSMKYHEIGIWRGCSGDGKPCDDPRCEAAYYVVESLTNPANREWLDAVIDRADERKSRPAP